MENERIEEQPEDKQPERQDKKPFFTKAHWGLFLWLYLSILFFECEVRLVSGVPFFSAGLIFICLFGAAVAFLLTAICCLLPTKAGFAVSIVEMALLTTLYIVQMFYYFMFNTFLTVFSLLNGMEALQFGGNIWATLKDTWPLVFLMFAPLVLYIILGRKLRAPRSPKVAAVFGALAVCAQVAGVILLQAFGTGYFTPYDYYYRNTSLNQSADKLGLFTTFRLDAQRYAFGFDAGAQDAAAAEPTPVPTFSHEQSESTQPIKPAADEAQPTPTPQPEYAYNVLDIDFDSLIANEQDSELLSMHQYFSSVQPTQQNAYTGMFEGYNLITITAESLAPYAIDEQLTPTLYKMMTQGFQFTNFYCPEWPVSTSDGEYVNNLGLIPKPGVWSLYLSGKHENYLPFALGNQFSALGYQTNAYHNNSYTYYERHISHPNLGYTYVGVGNGLEIDQTWPQSDYQMVDVTTDDFLESGKPFHTYYLTVSGHMMYNWDGNEMSQKHRALVEGLPLSEGAKAYLACNIELDRAMELLLERLEAAGVAEKTVIAIVPDHPPYGLKTSEVSELIGHDVEQTFEYYESTFILYNPGMEPQVVFKPCAAMDMLPTLSNLFGLPYDSRLLMGQDIFCDAQPLVVMGDRSWITDKARFNSNTGQATATGGGEADPAYVEQINKIVADKFTYSPKMLDTDYYRVVLEE